MLGMATVAEADSKCLTVEVIKRERMVEGTTAFLDNSGSTPRIVECDATGNTVWEYKLPLRIQPETRFANDLEWLPDQDHFLFTSRGRGVFEVDRGKSIVWSYSTSKASHDADRLPNGNTMFVWGNDTESDAQITEVNPGGKIVWQWVGRSHLAGEHRYETPEGRRQPYTYTHANAAIRLPSGNTLASFRNFHMVVEVNPEGDIVWKLGNLPRVHDPALLSNGNLLVSLFARRTFHPIREVTRSGEVVWEYSEPDLRFSTSVTRLANDNVLIAGRNMIVEVTREKEVVWRAFLPGVDASPDNQQRHLFKVVRIPAQK
jgi:hypothetical protein